MGGWETFGFGCLGVLRLNGVHGLEIYRTPRLERPTDFGERPYWVDFFGRAIIGACSLGSIGTTVNRWDPFSP